MFVPLSHPPGHAQCDFGEALVVIGGVQQKAHCFVLDLPHSDGCFVKAYPAETTEASLDSHVSAFAFLGGVPRSILYDNTRLAVARILGDGRRKRTKSFTELQSHYLFEDRFGRPGKGNDKGKVEGLVGYVRRNFLVPIPSVNKQLVMELARCEFVDHRENVIAVGNSGTGKTHVALGLGLAACQRGMSVGFTTAAGLVHEMIEARDERRLLNLQRHMSRLKLLIIDELGFVPLSRTGAELLFEVFSQRCERGSILVTTNLPFDEWTEVFGSERLTGALLDRLTHHVHILEMNGESYRLKRSRENASPQASEEPDEE